MKLNDEEQNLGLNDEQAAEVNREVLKIKKHLKSLSKNQLIAMLIQQLAISLEQQNLNKMLLEQQAEKNNEKNS